VASFEEIAKKKVAGVPVLYLAGGFVIILAVVAYKMKSSTGAVTSDANANDAANPSGADSSANTAADYSGLSTGGTVVVAPSTTTEKAAVETNETWGRSAVAYLITDKHVPPGDAQTAINLYLQGADLSFEQGGWRDAAIVKLGQPPEPLETIGKTSAAPAQKQFSNFPGDHVVKGANDNTPSKLAALYYGSGNTNNTNLIVEYNHSLGPASSTYLAGTKVHIPSRANPGYFTATSNTRYQSQIVKAAHVTGLTEQRLLDLNPNLSFPVNAGTKVRVI
jgi:hypothetical protein